MKLTDSWELLTACAGSSLSWECFSLVATKVRSSRESPKKHGSTHITTRLLNHASTSNGVRAMKADVDPAKDNLRDLEQRKPKGGGQGDCVSQSSCSLTDQALYQTAIPKKKGKSGRFGAIGRRKVFEDLLACQVFFGNAGNSAFVVKLAVPSTSSRPSTRFGA